MTLFAFRRKASLALLGGFLWVTSYSCVQLHHAQLGEIDDRRDYIQKPFDVKVSETGVNLEKVADFMPMADEDREKLKAVSYTHLTLPTICSV